jgi:hypothetical protein
MELRHFEADQVRAWLARPTRRVPTSNIGTQFGAEGGPEPILLGNPGGRLAEVLHPPDSKYGPLASGE